MSAPDPRQSAEYERAQIRLARASSAWLDAVEADFVTEERWGAITSEYHAAFAALAAIDPVRADGELGG